ncbi:MAG: carotenoid 1,2-hydratase [Spirochaetes bacterium]|nr:carotenoid 1,2-hydratase [Spirochaetota bacterium]
MIMGKIIYPSLSLFVFLILLSGCATEKIIYQPGSENLKNENLSKHVESWEDGLRTDPEGNSFEWWYFDFSFSDGTTAVMVFSTKNILNPGGQPDPQVSIVITSPEGRKISVSDTPGYNNFYSSKTACNVRIGRSSVEGNLNNYTLHFEYKGIQADLSLKAEAPAWRPGSGKMYLDKDHKKYFAWLPAVPYGTVTGTITYDGTAKKVSGTGYHDHNWGNVKLDKILTQWYWGRMHIDDYTLIFSRMLTSPEYGSRLIPVFYLAKKDKIISDYTFKMIFKPSKWKRHLSGRDYPENIAINISQENGTIKLELFNPRIIEARSLIDNLPGLLQFFIKLFTNPYYFRFNSKVNLQLRIGGISVQKQGSGIFEMMLLRGKHTVRND